EVASGVVRVRTLAGAPPRGDRPGLTVDGSGFRLDATVGWIFGWSLRDYGAGSLVAHGARLEITHNGLEEWYEHRENGVQLGLRIDDVGASRVTTLDYVLAGNLTPKLGDDAHEIAFAGGSGAPVLRLDALRAVGPEGQDVDLAWAIVEGGLRLVVQTAGHPSPITVSARLLEPTGSLVVPTNDQCAGAAVIPGTGPFPYTTAAYDITDATTAGDPAAP